MFETPPQPNESIVLPHSTFFKNISDIILPPKNTYVVFSDRSLYLEFKCQY